MSIAPMLDTFPLAEGVSAQIADAIAQLQKDGEGLFVTKTTDVTRQLLRYWFQDSYCELRNANFHVGQRDAILAVIYVHEVLGLTSLSDLYKALAPDSILQGDLLGEISDSRNDHPKYAAKMATGTGKTWVLNALLIWQYLNAVHDAHDRRFTNNFLIVAPGLIVYERLLDSFLGKYSKGSRDFGSSDIYSMKQLFVPEVFESQLFSFLQNSVATKGEIGRKTTGGGVIAITNWHLLAGQEDPDFEVPSEEILAAGADIDLKSVAASFIPLSPGLNAGNSLSALDRKSRRGNALEYLIDLPSLVVFNDEAHHIHSLKKGEEVSEVEWQKSLRLIAENKKSKFIQVDFSATPYNEVGTGRSGKQKKYFPHIVVDFDLRSAMSAGLVKTLLLDRRQEIAALPLEFKVERDDSGNVTLSSGQKTMIRAGLTRLDILSRTFVDVDANKSPKMMIVVEDTSVVPLVEEFLLQEGFKDEDFLSVHSGKKAELGLKDWEPVRERLFALDKHPNPRVIISVLMLREGFDVNNICVIVPLRASQASILLEQTIGRGLRLMWRGDSAIDDLKSESRRLIREKREPNNFFDMLFVVEHPAFSDFYDELMNGAGSVFTDDEPSSSAKGDIEKISLKENFSLYDFEIPIILRDPIEEIREPEVDPLTLKTSRFPIDHLRNLVGQGDRFSAEAVENGLRFGDYRVDGGVMTATGYNDFLSRLATRIVDAHQRAFVGTNQKYKEVSAFPVYQSYQRLVIGWVNSYIRFRYFGASFEPLENENWRLLLVPGVAEEISSEIGYALVAFQENISLGGAEVVFRSVSEVDSITIRHGSSVELEKCIFQRQPFPSLAGGLERDFMKWVDSDAKVEALLKIHEYKHDFLRRPYLKFDGMPAQYSPDFLVRTDASVYLVETKSQSSLSDINVQRKRKSALNWANSINALDAELRGGRAWSYVLAGEQNLRSYMDNGGSASDYLATTALVENVNEELGALFW